VTAEDTVLGLKTIVRETLGTAASPLLLARLMANIDAAGANGVKLREACDRVTKTVNLFVGQDLARLLRDRLDQALKAPART
jgi:hypothetical protein